MQGSELHVGALRLAARAQGRAPRKGARCASGRAPRGRAPRIKSLRLAARRSQAVPTLAEGGEGAGLRDKGRMGLCNRGALHVAEYRSGGGPIRGRAA